jgi:hypothetical protein
LFDLARGRRPSASTRARLSEQKRPGVGRFSQGRQHGTCRVPAMPTSARATPANRYEPRRRAVKSTDDRKKVAHERTNSFSRETRNLSRLAARLTSPTDQVARRKDADPRRTRHLLTRIRRESVLACEEVTCNRSTETLSENRAVFNSRRISGEPTFTLDEGMDLSPMASIASASGLGTARGAPSAAWSRHASSVQVSHARTSGQVLVGIHTAEKDVI